MCQLYNVLISGLAYDVDARPTSEEMSKQLEDARRESEKETSEVREDRKPAKKEVKRASEE